MAEEKPDAVLYSRQILTKQQVKVLLDAASTDLNALLTGFLYTGCRPGELVKARVKDLDVRAGGINPDDEQRA